MRTRTKEEILGWMTPDRMADEILRLDRIVSGQGQQIGMYRVPPVALQGEPVSIPSDVLDAAKAMQKDGYRGPLAWAKKVIDFVADYTAPLQGKENAESLTSGDGKVRDVAGGAQAQLVPVTIRNEADLMGLIESGVTFYIQPSIPSKQEPTEHKLPYDVTVGGGTFRTGVSLETFVNAAKRWHRAAYPQSYELTQEQKDANFSKLTGGAV